MQGQDIVSIVATYVLTLLFLLGTHAFVACMDGELYKHNKFNEDRKTIKVGLKWLFWRFKKNDRREIFIIAFIHELINVILFVVVTTMLIVTFLLKEELIMFISFMPVLVYFLYCLIRQRLIVRKYRVR